MATADVSYTFGTTGSVVNRTPEFGFFNEAWIAETANLFVGLDILTVKDVDGPGVSMGYGDEAVWDPLDEEDSHRRPLGGAPSDSGPLSSEGYNFYPEHLGKPVGLDKMDPQIPTEGGEAAALMARERISYSYCRQYIDLLVKNLLFGTTTPFAVADVAMSGALSVAATDLGANLDTARQTAGILDGETFNELALSYSHWREFMLNTAAVGQYGGNVGAGNLAPLAMEAMRGFGIERVHVFRSRWGTLGNFLVLFRSGAVQGRRIRQSGDDANGILVQNEIVPGTFGNVPLAYASTRLDAFAIVDGGVRLSGA